MLCIYVHLFSAGTHDKTADDNFSKKQDSQAVLASTSWTAAFADIAGIDGVDAIAPAGLQHPPEYEITVSDIQKVLNSSVLIYGGYERMIQTIADSVGEVSLIKIHTDNSLDTVTKQTLLIADITGTRSKREIRLAKYATAIEDGKKQAEILRISSQKVLCHRMHLPLARDLGLNIAGVFGPEPVTAAQISDAGTASYDIIIDNIHNPVSSPLAAVAPGARVILWRNFPSVIEHDALIHVIQHNMDTLFSAGKEQSQKNAD